MATDWLAAAQEEILALEADNARLKEALERASKPPTFQTYTYTGNCCSLCGRVECRGGCFK